MKLPNLPFHCWTMDSLSRIGSTLGVPICADSCTTRQLRRSFARLLVEIDITKPLVHSVVIEGPAGSLVEQKVVYEWTPPFCQACNKVGHDCGAKKKKKEGGAQPPKQRKKWVPKVVVAEKEASIEVQAPAAADIAVQDSHGGETGGVVTPVVPIVARNEGWQAVTKPSGRAKRPILQVDDPVPRSNSYMSLIEEEGTDVELGGNPP